MESMERVGGEKRGFRKLLVYQRILEFIKVVYSLLELLPKKEEFALNPQMRRAVVSILSNFSEGYLRRSNKDKIHFLEIAETSHHELEAQADICEVLGYWSENDRRLFDQKSDEVGYLMWRYVSKIPKV